jgi:sec-independent protein translocase protein TatA
MLGGFGGAELIVIGFVILIFFGADKIPELARGIGQGMNEFKKASDNLKKEIDQGKKSYSSAPKKEKPAKETKEDVVEEKQEKSTENS